MLGGNESVIYNVSNFTIGSGSVSYKVDKYAESTDSLTVKIGTTTIATRSNVTGTAVGTMTKSITFSGDEITKIFNAMPKTTKATFSFVLTSKIGTQTIGTTTATATGTLPTALKPAITNITLTESVSGIASKFGAFIKNKSKLNYSYAITNATGTTTSSYNLTINGKTYTAKSGTTNAINNSGTVSYSAYVIDARGRKSETYTKAITVLDYENPKITEFSVIRCDANGNETNEGAYAKYTVVASISAVNNKNDKTFIIDYKKQADSTWTTWKTYTDGYTLKETSSVLAITTDDAYHFRIRVIDYFNNTDNPASKIQPLSSAFTLMDILEDGTGLAFGKVATESETFDIGFKQTYLSKDTYVGGQEDTREKNIIFTNPIDSTNVHNTKLYGGNATSPVAMGMWDRDNNLPVFQYFDGTDYRFKFGDDITLKWGNYGIEAILEKVNNSLSGTYKTKEGLLIQWGSVNVTASTSGTPEKVDITFPVAYSKIPVIMVSVSSAVPGTSITGYSHGSDTTTGTSLYVTRTNTTSTGTRWLAIGYVE